MVNKGLTHDNGRMMPVNVPHGVTARVCTAASSDPAFQQLRTEYITLADAHTDRGRAVLRCIDEADAEARSLLEGTPSRYCTDQPIPAKASSLRPTNLESQFQGVYRTSSSDQFVARICSGGSSKHLGTFSSAEQAGSVYAAAFNARGLRQQGHPVNCECGGRLGPDICAAKLAAKLAEKSTASASSKYRGVTRVTSGKWQAVMCVNGNQEYLGQFEDEEDAARAWDRRAIELGRLPNFDPMATMTALTAPLIARTTATTTATDATTAIATAPTVTAAAVTTATAMATDATMAMVTALTATAAARMTATATVTHATMPTTTALTATAAAVTTTTAAVTDVTDVPTAMPTALTAEKAKQATTAFETSRIKRRSIIEAATAPAPPKKYRFNPEMLKARPGSAAGELPLCHSKRTVA